MSRGLGLLVPRLGLIDSLATVVSLGVEESPNKIGLDTYSLDVVESSAVLVQRRGIPQQLICIFPRIMQQVFILISRTSIEQ